MTGAIVTFVVVCLATSFVSTSLKEDPDPRLVKGTLRLFAVMAGGIVGFTILVQAMGYLAG